MPAPTGSFSVCVSDGPAHANLVFSAETIEMFKQQGVDLGSPVKGLSYDWRNRANVASTAKDLCPGITVRGDKYMRGATMVELHGLTRDGAVRVVETEAQWDRWARSRERVYDPSRAAPDSVKCADYVFAMVQAATNRRYDGPATRQALLDWALQLAQENPRPDAQRARL